MSLSLQDHGFVNQDHQKDVPFYDIKGRLVIQTEFGIEYFTKREVEILKYIVQGYPAKKVGLLLGISYRTVESYVATLKMKLHCHRKSDLIITCMKLGFLKVFL